MDQKLTTTDHNRNSAGLKYVYPVISRRAGGLSIGINFNVNNACNWRCIYCQVPDLVRGAAPEMDFELLEKELRFFLEKVLNGQFFDQFKVSEQQRVIKDIAISGNGEPTSLKHFDKAVGLIAEIATEMHILPDSKFVLITNGSLMNLSTVQAGLKILNDYQGEVWYKLDSATEFGRKKINDSKQTNKKTIQQLEISSRLCTTSLQTCLIEYLKADDAENERHSYLALLSQFKKNQIKIKEVMLYTLARPSLQKEADQLSKLEKSSIKELAEKLRKFGYIVSVNS